MNTWEGQLYTGLMIWIRLSTWMVLVPFLGIRSVPAYYKNGFAILIAWLLCWDNGGFPLSMATFFLNAFREAIVGLLIGFGSKIVVFIAEFAAAVIANEMGLSMSQQFDPMTARQTTPIESILTYVTLLLIFITGMHRDLIALFVKSYDYIPIGSNAYLHSVEGLIRATSQVLSIGLQMAAPMIAVNFIVTMVFAVMGKAAPKINVFMISFSVRILAGLVLLLFTTHLTLEYIMRNVEQMPNWVAECLRV